MLVRELGSDAYGEARLMQNRARSTDETRHWRAVAFAVAARTGKRIGLDPATRMLADADLGGSAAASVPGTGPVPQPVDPIEELRRLVRKQDEA